MRRAVVRPGAEDGIGEVARLELSLRKKFIDRRAGGRGVGEAEPCARVRVDVLRRAVDARVRRAEHAGAEDHLAVRVVAARLPHRQVGAAAVRPRAIGVVDAGDALDVVAAVLWVVVVDVAAGRRRRRRRRGRRKADHIVIATAITADLRGVHAVGVHKSGVHAVCEGLARLAIARDLAAVGRRIGWRGGRDAMSAAGASALALRRPDAGAARLRARAVARVGRRRVAAGRPVSRRGRRRDGGAATLGRPVAGAGRLGGRAVARVGRRRVAARLRRDRADESE